MVSKEEREKWELYLEKRSRLFRYGVENGLIYPFEVDESFMNHLREVYCYGVPASILLLCENWSNGFCYDQSFLIPFGFPDDDFSIVHADIDGIAFNPEYVEKYRCASEQKIENERYAEHSFVERTRADGSVWVYDSSTGFVFSKELFYEIEHPKIRRIINKEEVIKSPLYNQLNSNTKDTDKYILPVVIPSIELSLQNGQRFHQEALEKELLLFKSMIDYDSICQEVYQDMKVMGLLR